MRVNVHEITEYNRRIVPAVSVISLRFTGYRFTITSHVTLNVFSLAVTESTGEMDTSCVLNSMMTSAIPNLTLEVIPVQLHAVNTHGGTHVPKPVRLKDVQCTWNFCYSRHSGRACTSIFQRY